MNVFNSIQNMDLGLIPMIFFSSIVIVKNIIDIKNRKSKINDITNLESSDSQKRTPDVFAETNFDSKNAELPAVPNVDVKDEIVSEIREDNDNTDSSVCSTSEQVNGTELQVESAELSNDAKSDSSEVQDVTDEIDITTTGALKIEKTPLVITENTSVPVESELVSDTGNALFEGGKTLAQYARELRMKNGERMKKELSEPVEKSLWNQYAPDWAIHFVNIPDYIPPELIAGSLLVPYIISFTPYLIKAIPFIIDDLKSV